MWTGRRGLTDDSRYSQSMTLSLWEYVKEEEQDNVRRLVLGSETNGDALQLYGNGSSPDRSEEKDSHTWEKMGNNQQNMIISI